MSTAITEVKVYDSALSMAKAIQDGKVTSRQLVDMHIARIEAFDLKLKINAVVQRDWEGARQRADQADEELHQAQKTGKQKQLGVFHGVPMTIKEGIPVPGFAFTQGDPALTYAAPLLTNLSNENARLMIEEGGAILMGKTNLPINQCDWETNNPVYGRTGNPYDVTRSPGGSSGGPAAALASGFTPLEIGSDIGGSIRIPSMLCGVVGHCPTRGLTPTLDTQFGCCGCFDRMMNKLTYHLFWMGRAGPVARDVEDVIAMTEILCEDKLEGIRRPSVTGNSSLKDYRIGIWKSSHEICPPGKEVTAALDKAVAVLKSAGVTVEEVQPPVDPNDTYKVYLRYLSSFMGLHLPKTQKQNVKKGCPKDSYPSDIKSPFADMDECAVNGIPEGTDSLLEEYTAVWDEYLKTKFDVVLCPIFPCEAWSNASGPEAMLSSAEVLSRPLTIDGQDRYYGDSLFWPHLQVLLGLPATGFPVKFTDQGLPVGLQAFGPKNNDFIVLDVVQKLMHSLGRNKFQPPNGLEV